MLALRLLLVLRPPSFPGAARCAVLIILVLAVMARYVAGTRLALVVAVVIVVEEEDVVVEENMVLAARSCLAITIGAAEGRCCHP